MNQRTMLRFLKLMACENVMIDTYAKLVDGRNEAAQHLRNGRLVLHVTITVEIESEISSGADR